jgi:hypothetical protein
LVTPNDILHHEDGTTEIFVESRAHGTTSSFVNTEDYIKYELQNYRWILFVPSKARTKYIHTKAPHPSGGLTKKGHKRSRSIFLHALIMETPKGMHTDHINGDSLDNRRQNLRVCTPSQNATNKRLRRDSQSGYKGVYELKKPIKTKYVSKKTGEVKYYFSMPKKKFQAYIANPDTPAKRKRHIKLGWHTTAEEAAVAYDKKAVEIHGDFANINFPDRLEEYRKELENEKINDC